MLYPPLLQEVKGLVEEYLQTVFVMGRLTASADDRSSTRLTLSVENANANDSHPYGGARENGSEPVKGFESGSDCEKLVYEDSSLMVIRSGEGKGYASANVNESRGVRLNASESAISRLGSENVDDQSHGRRRK